MSGNVYKIGSIVCLPSATHVPMTVIQVNSALTVTVMWLNVTHDSREAMLYSKSLQEVPTLTT